MQSDREKDRNIIDIYKYFYEDNYKKDYIESIRACINAKKKNITSYFFPYFNWDEITEKENTKFKEFIKENFGENWIETAKIIKSDGGNTIIVSTSKEEQIILKLNEKKDKVTMVFKDGKIFELFAEEAKESGKLNVYLTEKILKNENFFYVARRFNSYTPILPSAKKKYTGRKGGGYLIKWKNKLIAIDPGYNFIENIYFNENIRIKDIDCIIITHAHPDHISDFENLLILLYEYNDELRKKYVRDYKNDNERNYHCIDVIINLTASQRFLDMIHNNKYIKQVKILNPGDTLHFTDYDMDLKAIKSIHKEYGLNGYSVGLFFYLHNEDKHVFKLALTSDTAWDEKLNKEYKDAELLVAHIGGIKLREIELDFHKYNFNELYYKNHLGFIGTYNLISGVDTENIILSEFGEELVCTNPINKKHIDNRIQLSQILSEILLNYKDLSKKIIPGEIGLKIFLPNLTIKCKKCAKLIKFEDIIPYESAVSTDAVSTEEVYNEIIYCCKSCLESKQDCTDT